MSGPDSIGAIPAATAGSRAIDHIKWASMIKSMRARSSFSFSLLVGAILWMLSSTVLATAQITDLIEIDGEPRALQTHPLEALFRSNPDLRKLIFSHGDRSVCSASWRGYRATWKIQQDELYLENIEVEACSDEPRTVPLSALFPGQSAAVKAVWFSGALTIPEGRMIKYVHLGYESRFEAYLVVDVERGKVVRRSGIKSVPH